MNVTFLIYSMEIGGTERVTHDLINEFVSRGINVNLICLNANGYFLNDLHISTNDIFEVGEIKNIFDIFKVTKIIQKQLLKKTSDIFIAMGEYPNIIAPFVKFNGKTILVEHNIKSFYTDPDSYNLSFSMKLISKIAYRKANTILCVSENIRNILISKGTDFEKKSFVIYNPLDENKINILSKESLDYKTKNLKIINVGRLTEQKNIFLLLEAFQKNYKKNKNIELWLVGDGPKKKELQDMCKILQIDKNVIFWGFQENPYKFILNSDFFVSSSNYEGFSLVIFETIFIKKRVIVTRSISDFDKLITPDLGQVVPVNNLTALTEAIEFEIKNKNHIIYDNKKIKTMFNLSTIADSYIKYFY